MSNISRSVYQKVCEENKRLKNDLKIICYGNTPDSILLKHKYRDQFQEEDNFNRELRECLGIIRKENPNAQ